LALTKETVLDKVEFLEDGSVQVRRATYVLEDGVRIAGPMYQRSAYTPGDDIALEHPTVRALAPVVWTPEVIAAAQARKQAREQREPRSK